MHAIRRRLAAGPGRDPSRRQLLTLLLMITPIKIDYRRALGFLVLTGLLTALPAQPAPERRGDGPPGERPRQGQGARPARPPTWLMPKIEGANLHYETFDSKAAGEKVSYLIYLPPGYEKSGDQRYPVVYWLHGIGGSQRGVPAIADRFTAAIQAGKAPEMIVVFVNGMVDSFWCDAVNVARPVETVFIEETIPLIDATYRTITTRDGRMIEGFSMGGFGAGHYGFKYPDLFGSVSILDGAVLGLGTMKTRHADIFQRIWDGRDELFNRAHPANLAEKNVARIKGDQVIRQAVGMIVGDNQALHQKLNQLGIEHEYVETGARHNPGEVYEKLGEANWAFYGKAFASAASAPAREIAAKASAPEMAEGFKLEGTKWTYHEGDLTMTGVLYKPEGPGPFPALLISHGRGGTAEAFGGGKAREFVKMGFVCIAPNYTHAGPAGGANANEGGGARRRPEGTPRDPNAPRPTGAGAGGTRREGGPGGGAGQLAGAGAPGASEENLKRASKCLDLLQGLPYVDGKRLAAYGNSMGAFITVALSASEAGRLRATAITAGGIGGRGGAFDVSASPPTVPMLILHGSADGTVPPDSSVRLKELLDGNKVPNERHLFDGIGHNLHQQKAAEVNALIKAWLAKHGLLNEKT